MRVLVVSQYFWPENFRVNDLVKELVERGHSLTVLTGEPNYPSGSVFVEFRRDPRAFDDFNGAKVVRVPIVPRGAGKARLVLNYLSFALSATVVGAWRLRGEAFDAIFVFQPSPITLVLPAVFLRRVKHAPLLLWVLDLWPETLSAVGVVRSPRVLGWVSRLVSFIYRRCDLILVQSRSFAANVERHSGQPGKIRYFPSWAEPVFEGSLDAVVPAQELANLHGKFIILFAGNIGDAQDFPSILDAAEALRDAPDVRWVVVGDGRMSEWLHAEIARRRLEGVVLPLGRFPIDRMPSFFRVASALLVTLKNEPVFELTIPGKVQAYLAAGIPILAMLGGEGARVIQESGAGLVCPPGRGDLLAERVRELSALPVAALRRMSDSARTYCMNEFNRDKLVSHLEQWMRDATHQR